MKDQIWFIAAMVVGLTVSVLCSEKHSFGLAVARIMAGLFCSVFLSDPLIHYLALDPDTYRNGIAGLMAMCGYAITRFLVNMDSSNVVELIKSIRGHK